MTTIRVEYLRTVSAPGSYSSTKVGGSVELSLAKADEWDRQWREAYDELKAQVDAVLPAAPEPTPVAATVTEPTPTAPATPTAVPSPATTSTTEEVSQPEHTVDSPEAIKAALAALAATKEPIELTSCRVMFDPDHYQPEGRRREKVRMRIGCADQIPGQWISIESSEQSIMDAVDKLRKGDMVNVKGYVRKPWKKQGEDVYDLECQAIERIH